MYNSQIVVRFQMDGTHYWKDCPIKEVAFLRDNHHHTFFFELKKSVSHDDRDIELIKWKRDIQDYLNLHYYDANARCLVFGGMSCEMIAKELCQRFGCEEVSVFEDNIVGGVVKKEQIEWPNVVVVAGRTACGKGTFIENEFPGYRRVSVSSIIKDALNGADPQSDANTTDLDRVVIDTILPQITFYEEPIVIDGPRQLTIIQAIVREMESRNHHKDYSVVWIDAPTEIRKERFRRRLRPGKATFSQIDMNNDVLGLKDVEDLIKDRAQKHPNSYKIIKFHST